LILLEDHPIAEDRRQLGFGPQTGDQDVRDQRDWQADAAAPAWCSHAKQAMA
jgi:hypothetical protein